jgi:hypothetical protein
MPAPKARTKLEREEHLARVAKLHMRGLTQHVVAKETGRSQGQICKDIKLIESRWLEEQLRSMGVIKARLSATLQQLASEAWDEWSATKDPRHFANALASVRDLRALIGADAPRKTQAEISGSLEVRHVDELTDEDLDAIARGDYTDDEDGTPVVGSKRIALASFGT